MPKGPGGKSAGRVSIRVVPDTTRFKSDLERSLNRIEKSTVLNLSVGFDTRSADLDLRKAMKRWQDQGQRAPITVPTQVSDLDKTWQSRLKSQVAAATKRIEATIPAGVDGERMRADLQAKIDEINRTLKIQIPTDPEKAADFRSKLNSLVDEINGKTGEVDVDLKTAGALTHLREFLRRRSLNVDINISKSSLAKATTIIASLSGARVAGDLVKNISERLQNLDRSLPKIAAVVLGIGSIGAAALSSVGGLATLLVSLSGILGLAGPLPGILGAAATGAVVLGVALSSASDELSSLAPVWTNLKSIITDNFWDKARQPIIDFVRSTLPQLRAGLAPVAASLGAWTASIADGFKKAFGDGVLEGMLAKLRESIDISSTGTGGFANAIATLGTFGAKYLPRLAQWFADLANRFDAWISKVAADGSLDRWAETGITVAKQLFDVLGSVLSIISGVASAAEAAGGGGLTTFTAVLARIADVVNSPAFQTTLTTLFEGAAAGVSGLASALAPIGSMLADLAPTLSLVLSSIGVTLGTVLGQIASTLAQPEIASAILALFNGIRDGIQGLLPALPSLGTALAAVAKFAGVLAGQLGEVLGQTLITLSPLVVTLLDALAPLVPQLGDALVNALITLTPSFLQLVQAIVPILPQLATMAADLLPMLANTLVLVTPLLTGLLGAVSAILTPFELWMEAITAAQQVLDGIKTPMEFVSEALSGKFGPAIQWVAEILPPLVAALRDGLGGAAQFVGEAFQTVSGVIRIAINSVIDLVNGAILSLNALKVTIPSWVPGLGGQTFGLKIPTIPRLAIGADIEPTIGGTAVVLGEGGRKETVTDYGKTNALIAAASQLAARALAVGDGGYSGPAAEVHVHPGPGMDERTVGRIAAQEVSWNMRRN